MKWGGKGEKPDDNEATPNITRQTPGQDNVNTELWQDMKDATYLDPTGKKKKDKKKEKPEKSKINMGEEIKKDGKNTNNKKYKLDKQGRPKKPID